MPQRRRIMNKVHWLIDLQQYLDLHLEETLYANESVMDYNVASYIEQRQSPSFSKKLLYFVDLKAYGDTEVYKKAGIDRKLFSKIRSNTEYQPKKKTAFALCLSLQLNINEAESLLRSAGYTFSNSHILDLIIQYCIEHRIYDLCEVNFVLDHYGLDPL